MRMRNLVCGTEGETETGGIETGYEEIIRIEGR
jgi:hypothetical protein